MNIGILKIGANITQSSAIKTASNLDIFSLAEPLIEKGFDITIITKKTRNTLITKNYKLIEIMEFDDYDNLDCLLVFNGAINFFGGVESPELIKNFNIIVKCQNVSIPVFYVMTDCRYPLKQIWPVIKDRDWGVKYLGKELWVGPVNYIYQGKDHRKLSILLAKGKNIVPCNKIHSLNIPWAVMLRDIKVITTETKLRPYDLFYGGANRDSFRAKRFREFYANHNYKVATAGSIKVDFNPFKKFATIPNNMFVKTMANAKATVIIGDQFMCDNFYTLRMFESIFAGCVTFIDHYFDTKHLFYASITDKYLRDFLYPKNFRELVGRLDHLYQMHEIEVVSIRKEQLQAIKNLNDPYLFKKKLINIITGED